MNHSTLANNVFLRNVTESDLPIFFEQQRDPEATAMAAFPPRDLEAFMLHWGKIMADQSGIQKTILFDSQVAGNICCWGTPDEQEIGYLIGREFWGKGIATAALTEFLSFLTIRPLFAHVAKHNAASKRVLEKCGFVVVGEGKYLDRNGREVEEVVFKLDRTLFGALPSVC